MKQLIFLLLIPSLLLAQTIAEKKAHLPQEKISVKGPSFNEAMAALKTKRDLIYKKAELAINECQEAAIFEELNHEFKQIQSEMRALEDEVTLEEVEEDHSLWHHPQITLKELAADYSQNYLYVLSPQAADAVVSLSSHLAIYNQSWDELIELIASSMGFQVLPLNPFVKQITADKELPISSCSLVSSLPELSLIPPHKRVCFLFQEKQTNLQMAAQLLQKFVPEGQVKLCRMTNLLIMTGTAGQIKQLLEMWSMVGAEIKGHSYKMITLERLSALDVQKALSTYFHDGIDRFVDNKTPRTPSMGDLKILPLTTQPPAIFLVGSPEQILMAEEIICSLEKASFDPKEKMLFCYTCQNSKAEEVAKVLKQVYNLMQKNPLTPGTKPVKEPPSSVNYNVIKEEGFYDEPNIPSLIVNPGMAGPGSSSSCKESDQGYRDNFIVDSKSGAIIMVIEKESLEKIKELLIRLDTPKKMVQIEVLLFEKRVTSEDRIGLNLLKVGSKASNTNSGGFSFNDPDLSPPGILAFFLSHAAGGGLPAFDLIYNFLLSQEEIQINACPSVTTINQTPAKIALVEEISVNNGAIIVDYAPSNAVAKDSYSRAQYGITIEITPTIHASLDPCHMASYITLETDITFDTTKPSKDNRPDVTRRNIKNQVRVANGETVVLGGLRRKMSHEEAERIPFWGELPILGKLFSQNKLRDSQTEMFVFLTPRIINDGCDVERMTLQELAKRPGDCPCLIDCIIKAKEREKEALFTGSMQLMMMGP